jgi:ribonuclease P protein component
MAKSRAKQGGKHGAKQRADRGAEAGAGPPGCQSDHARSDTEAKTLAVTLAVTRATPASTLAATLASTPASTLDPTVVAAFAQTGAGGLATRIVTLKRRSEFLRVRRGERCARPAFVLEAKLRDENDRAVAAKGARFGFTVTRQVGKAVERNRIRRRLKAAIAAAAGGHAKHDCDYVLIARRAALALPFDALVSDLVVALDRVHRSIPQRGRHKETGSKLAG